MSFNPTMVRLLPEADLTAFANFGSFNPTMVRLLLGGQAFMGLAKSEFQSHNGAIAA